MDGKHSPAADAYDFGYVGGRMDAKYEIIRAVKSQDKETLSVGEIIDIVKSIPDDPES